MVFTGTMATTTSSEVEKNQLEVNFERKLGRICQLQEAFRTVKDLTLSKSLLASPMRRVYRTRIIMMWRAFFSAIGIVLVILGVECLLIDSAVLAAGVVDDPMALQQNSMFGTPLASTQSRIFRPAEWIPWSLLASGAVVLIYAISLKRANG